MDHHQTFGPPSNQFGPPSIPIIIILNENYKTDISVKQYYIKIQKNESWIKTL